MVRTLILTQGDLARELLDSALRISGEGENVEAMTLAWDEDRDVAASRLRETIEKIDEGAGVLILTDIPGATPFNAARTLQGELPIAVASGVNLPMIVRLLCCQPEELDLRELTAWILEKGRLSICASDAETSGNGHADEVPDG